MTSGFGFFIFLVLVVTVGIIFFYIKEWGAQKDIEDYSPIQKKPHYSNSKDFLVPKVQPRIEATSYLSIPTLSAGGNQSKKQRLPALQIKYTNTSDITHMREIKPIRARANMDYFEAYCHLEGTHRSFRFDRVHYAINLEIGEILSQSNLYLLVHPKRKSPDWLEIEPIHNYPSA